MFFLYLSMRPKAPDNQANQPVVAEDPLANDPLASAADANQAETGQAEIDSEPETSLDGDNSAEKPKEIGASRKPSFPSKTVTLGSMDPSKGYHLLVTLTSKGAGVERAELVKQTTPGKFDYRALETKGGYLGHLGLNNDLQITTIPDGSPASKAVGPGGETLQIGDRLTSLAGQEILGRFSVDAALKNEKPESEVEFSVERASEGGDTKTLTFTATLTETPLDVLRTFERESEFVAGNNQRPSLRTTLASLNDHDIQVGLPAFPSLSATLDQDWEVKELEVPGGQGVEFRLPLGGLISASQPNQIELVKRYRLMPAQSANDPDAFLLDLETVVENKNDQSIQASFRQEGLNGLTLEGWWYSVKISPYTFSAAGQRDVAYWTHTRSGKGLETTREIADHAKETPNKPNMLFGSGESIDQRSLDYIGLDSQYFSAAVLPHEAKPESLLDLHQAAAVAVADAEAIPKSKKQATNTSFWFDTTQKEIAPGGELAERYSVYIGPKLTEILEAHGLENTIEYGWFGWIAKPLSKILHFFHRIVGNYGIAIVMLTLVVRSLLFPFSRKAMMSSQKMQERMQVMQPEMKKINEKYKDNFEKRSKALQELYAKHNFNPAENLAGCLPMFFQLPVFMGLYRCLSVDISLRQEPLLPGLNWCENLAGPDMLFNWSSWMPEFIAGRGTGWLGPYFNILPLVTVALFLVQQKMLMPKATDEQTRMTQNMMQFMTIFMGVLFFKVPSGLCIYFITSSMWSLVERKLIKRTTPAKSTGVVADSSTSTKDGSGDDNGSSTNGKGRRRANRDRQAETKAPSRFDELRQLLDKPAVKSTTQRGPAPGSAKGGKKRRKRR